MASSTAVLQILETARGLADIEQTSIFNPVGLTQEQRLREIRKHLDRAIEIVRERGA